MGAFSIWHAILILGLVSFGYVFLKPLWGMRKVRRGQKFGNRVADYMGINSSLFHMAIEAGGLPNHLNILAEYQDQGMSLRDARDTLAPFVRTGINSLESKFGNQILLSDAKKAMDKIHDDWQGLQLEPSPLHSDKITQDALQDTAKKLIIRSTSRGWIRNDDNVIRHIIFTFSDDEEMSVLIHFSVSRHDEMADTLIQSASLSIEDARRITSNVHLGVLITPPINVQDGYLIFRGASIDGRQSSSGVKVKRTQKQETLFWWEDKDEVLNIASVLEDKLDVLFEFYSPSGLLVRFPVEGNDEFRDLLHQARVS